jgi:sugar/nucleoside kinase (ribokinase family)
MMDYLAIGHITADVWQEGITPGGSVTYASLTARTLLDRVSVLTAAANDMDTAATFPAIEVHCLEAPNTTHFRNVYTSNGRMQIVSPCPITLQPQHMTSAMRESAIVHLAPVCNEVSPHIVQHVHADTFVGITPQGWMRRWDGDGRVTSLAAHWVDAALVLARANAVVISIHDIAEDWHIAHDWASQTQLLVVTQGAQGCTAFLSSGPTHVPAPHVQEVEPTGAGDIFATVLFTALQRGGSPLDACAFANCIAAQSVTRSRLQGVPTPQDIASCQHWALKETVR